MHSRPYFSFVFAVLVNGFVCKNPMDAKPEDFFMDCFDKPGDTANPLGSAVTTATVAEIPGLNTLGISLARLDYAPKGLIAPHYHPRATEILTVVEGTLNVGFVTSNPDNVLFAKVLNKGDVFVFPKALIHFQFNPSHDAPAVAISGLSSQNPGVVTIADTIFGANPPISDEVLAKAFQLDKKTVDWLQAQFSKMKN